MTSRDRRKFKKEEAFKQRDVASSWMKATDLRVDFQMQLSHAGDDGFFALRVKMHSKGWIFSGEPVNGFGEFILVILARGN